MDLYEALGETTTRVRNVAGTTARAVSELAGSSPVEATGQSAKPSPTRVGPSPAVVATVFALAAVGALAAMRVVFRGAIS